MQKNLGIREGFNKDCSKIYEKHGQSNLIKFDTSDKTTLAWKRIMIETLDNKEFYTGVAIENQLFFDSIESFNERFLIDHNLNIRFGYESYDRFGSYFRGSKLFR
ncbi:MAG: hypothetical protein WBA54_12820 [Acidaminobacteraceae bacterium]